MIHVLVAGVLPGGGWCLLGGKGLAGGREEELRGCCGEDQHVVGLALAPLPAIALALVSMCIRILIPVLALVVAIRPTAAGRPVVWTAISRGIGCAHGQDALKYEEGTPRGRSKPMVATVQKRTKEKRNRQKMDVREEGGDGGNRA